MPNMQNEVGGFKIIFVVILFVLFASFMHGKMTKSADNINFFNTVEPASGGIHGRY